MTKSYLQSKSQRRKRPPNAFIPGLHTLGKDEILEADESVYGMRHMMNTDWPCLSFDVLRDDGGGDQRQHFPASAYIVAGTQADAATKKQLTLSKMTTKHRLTLLQLLPLWRHPTHLLTRIVHPNFSMATIYISAIPPNKPVRKTYTCPSRRDRNYQYHDDKVS
jgi:hypothetical protein